MRGSRGSRPPRPRGAAADTDDHYARERARRARRRADLERRDFDPAPPGDEDWTVAEEETDGLRRIRPPTPLGEALGSVVARRGWHERLHSATIWRRWDEVVGADMTRHCEPVRVAGGTLVVRAASPAWATQLRYLVPQLRQNAAEVLGEGVVRDVRIVVGPPTGEETAT